MSWQGPRIVTVFIEEHPLDLVLVLIPKAPHLRRLSADLREYVRQDTAYITNHGPEPGRLSTFLEARGFTVPSSYATHWPFAGKIGTSRSSLASSSRRH